MNGAPDSPPKTVNTSLLLASIFFRSCRRKHSIPVLRRLSKELHLQRHPLLVLSSGMVFFAAPGTMSTSSVLQSSLFRRRNLPSRLFPRLHIGFFGIMSNSSKRCGSSRSRSGGRLLMRFKHKYRQIRIARLLIQPVIRPWNRLHPQTHSRHVWALRSVRYQRA